MTSWIRIEAVAVAVALAIALIASPALAKRGKRPVRASTDSEAKALLQWARKAYDVGDFEKALGAYSEAYKLKPAPGLVFNIGQCHRQLGNYAEAAFFYRRFLALDPRSPSAPTVSKLAAEMEGKAAQKERGTTTPAEAPRADGSRGQSDSPVVGTAPRVSGPRASAPQQGEAHATAAFDASTPKTIAQTKPSITSTRPPAITAEPQPERVTIASPRTPAAVEPTPPWKNGWVWTGVGVVAAGAAAAFVLTSQPRRPEATLGTIAVP